MNVFRFQKFGHKTLRVCRLRPFEFPQVPLSSPEVPWVPLPILTSFSPLLYRSLREISVKKGSVEICSSFLVFFLACFFLQVLFYWYFVHMRASVKESKGYPPRKILDRCSSPSGRRLFGKIFPPPFGKIWAKNPKSPPLAWKIWKIFEIIVN